MQTIAKFHHQAMEYADRAEIARRQGNTSLAFEFSKKAFELEKNAAYLLKDDFKMEPTRSVLHRSAATLALECGEIREAERLISFALAGYPPFEIAEELRNLLEDVYLQRHLDVHGIDLQQDEFQMSMLGDAVGFGVAPTYSIVNRIKDLETLIYRTLERVLGRPFKEAGRREKRIAESLALFMSAPRAGSFTITFRLGESRQLNLFNHSLSKEIVEDVFYCMELVSIGNIWSLKQRIPDQSYFKNFLALTKKIAPDGKKIRAIGFTRKSDGVEKRFAFTKKREQISKELDDDQMDKRKELVEIRGKLLSADATKRKIGTVVIIDNKQVPHNIVVPRGMMSDIVKPMFEEYVYVKARRQRNRTVLVDIQPEQE